MLQHYFENHDNVAEWVRKLRMDFRRREAPSAPYVRYLVKKWNKLASLSINQNVKSQKQCVHPRILLLWQKGCVKRHQHRLTVVLDNWTFRKFWKLERSCRLLHGQPKQPFEWNYFPLLNGSIVLSNKKRNLRKYSVVFFLSIFKKKKRFLADLIQ